MISHFFIDRPIFAAVLSIVITLTGGIALFSLPIAQYPQITPPAVQVSITTPGPAPRSWPTRWRRRSSSRSTASRACSTCPRRSGNDGSYTLTVTFDLGTDLNTALVMVQNRVALAMPQLPTAVQNQGITIRKKTPDILMIVNFFSPDGRYDDIYLSNFATINVRDELLRVDGVSDINYLGQRDYSIRAWLDPQKLASRNMTAIDVAERDPQPERRCARRPGRSAADSRRPGLSTAGRHAGPAHRPRAVRRHHRQGRRADAPARGRRPRHRPPPRRGPGRAGGAELQPVLHLRRQSVGRPGASTSSPAPTRSTSPTASARRWRS